MGRTPGLLFLLPALFLSAMAQDATTTMTTTTVTPATTVGQPMSGALPIPAPPAAALPGSGTPVGTAPALGVNDARTGGAGAVVQPGVTDLTVGGQPVAREPILLSTPVAAPDSATTGQPYSSGVALEGPQGAQASGEAAAPANVGSEGSTVAQPVYRRRFVGGQVNAAERPTSLGELAAKFRGNKPLAKRSFDNSDIMALNERAPAGLRSSSEDLPQSDQPVVGTRPKPKGVLDQNDLRKVEDAVKRSEEKSKRPK